MKLPSIDGRVLAQDFARRRMKRKIYEFIDAFGEERLSWLIANKKSLKDILPASKIADIKRRAGEYSYIPSIINRDDVWAALPDWVKTTIDSFGEEGYNWMSNELIWIVELFKTE